MCASSQRSCKNRGGPSWLHLLMLPWLCCLLTHNTFTPRKLPAMQASALWTMSLERLRKVSGTGIARGCVGEGWWGGGGGVQPQKTSMGGATVFPGTTHC